MYYLQVPSFDGYNAYTKVITVKITYIKWKNNYNNIKSKIWAYIINMIVKIMRLVNNLGKKTNDNYEFEYECGLT